MVKQPTSKGGTSHIRFIMIDAEIAEGDLNQITTAIQNALKPPIIVQQKPQLPSSVSASSANDGSVDLNADMSQDMKVDVDAAEPLQSSKTSRTPRQRKPTSPKVIDDLDLITGFSIESYAEVHKPKSEPEKNLVIAAWFKEHRSTSIITVAHVYTCYRFLRWPTGYEDFSWPLRALRRDDLMSNPKKGEYVINHLGLDRVRKMEKASRE